MIQCETMLAVADNSGAQKVACIRVLRGKKSATIGDVIIVAVKKALPKGKVKMGEVCKAVVVRVKKKVRCQSSAYISFNDNAVVIVNDKFELVGTRIFGTVSGAQLRDKKYNRILSLSEEVLS